MKNPFGIQSENKFDTYDKLIEYNMANNRIIHFIVNEDYFDFVKRAIIYFGYAPEIIQTDNGGEFCNTKKTDKIHYFDRFCGEFNIQHKTIRPKTPWHNGKVERSHRNDQERFYNYLKFYSYDDLLIQMKRYLKRSNNIPMAVLGWKSPLQKRAELEATPV